MRRSLQKMLPLAALAVLACETGRSVPGGDKRPPGSGGDGGSSGTDATPTDTGPLSGEHLARCMTACAAPADGPCASGDTNACAADCVTHTEGLSATCAQCIAERSGWAGEKCSCYGTGCNTCTFIPSGDLPCSGAAPDDTCAMSDEECYGLMRFPSTAATCTDACYGSGATTPSADQIADRCRLACKTPSSGPCSGQDTTACEQQCRTLVQGLAPACAICVTEWAGWSGVRCGCYGTGCNACAFSPVPTGCASPEPTDTCEPSDERCDGIVFGQVSDNCQAFCQ